MPSYKSNLAVLATAIFYFSGDAQAQYNIDPKTVPLATRQSWCTSQRSACPLLCMQLTGTSSTTRRNDCDPPTLVFNCICGNGLAPNASEFSQTIPYFECTEFGSACVRNCNGDATCQYNCRADNPCGAQNPIKVNTSTITTMSATATGGPGQATNAAGAFTGLGGAPAETAAAGGAAGSSGAESALNLGRSYGLAVIFAGVFAGFTLIM
ncbi:hypothetical protein HYALB_00008328 [Hymenoscyphus albidus]|uniref:DUF7707 domain-containing protein n=1 Tax=Hymenoscyphus albidus TaxID=595503 RepID=A0A9N9LF78_9HELO|nr:hypothetical protein HYALB_00008328 [Hymenoscyphus albidus]